MVYIIFLCLVIPLLFLLPLLERRSRLLLAFLLSGICSALVSYEINSLFFSLLSLAPREFSQVVPPIVEELWKACPVFFYAVFLDESRKIVLPAAMAAGIGFAILENTVILVQNLEAVTLAWAAARGFTASLMHGLCTMIVGTGLTYVKKQKKLFYTGTFGLLSIAITLHALFNLLIQSDYDYWGMAMPLLLYGLLFLSQKVKRLKLPFLSY